jgi:glycosyltransferase involved in cell wall biosynthesis
MVYRQPLRNNSVIQQPLFSDIGVCALVPAHWNSTWQPRHQILSRLAKYFHVLWVTPAPEWRAILHPSLGSKSYNTGPVPPPGLQIYEPEFWLPKLYRPKWAARFTFEARLKRAHSLLTRHGCRQIILYLWRPEFASALSSMPFDLSCYHIDDEYSFSVVEVAPDPVELKLIKDVDQVFIHSPGLLDRLGSINQYTTFVPNGVDYENYARATSEPTDLKTIARPRIGYAGVVKKHLDWPLLQQLTKRHHKWSFVFVGPCSPHPEMFPVIEELKRQGNVYFLGAKSVLDLAAYPQYFDICIMPYALYDYSAHYIYPLKLHEYLASGSPVVGTRIRSLEGVSELVRLAVTCDEWSDAITSELAPSANTRERREKRQGIAKQHDWDCLVSKIAKVMAERLGSKFPQDCGFERSTTDGLAV